MLPTASLCSGSPGTKEEEMKFGEKRGEISDKAKTES